MDNNNSKTNGKAVIERGSKSDILLDKLFRDLEEFLKEYSVREIGSSGLLISTKL